MSDEVDIFRRVYTRMWNDRRIMALSRPTPNAQTVWTMLLTGPQTGLVPGLFEIGERAFAELLGWPLHGGEALLEDLPKGLPKGFREAFGEVSTQGLVKADWKARLVWVPNGIVRNPPANPNVVKSWRKPWRALPECALKDEAEQAFKLFLKDYGKGFGEAFGEVIGNSSPKQDSGSRKQEAGGGKRAPRAETPPPIETTRDALAVTVTNAMARELFEHWQAERERVHKAPQVLMAPPAAIEAAKSVLVNAGGDMALAKDVVTRFVESKHGYWLDRHHALWLLSSPRDFEQARLSFKRDEKKPQAQKNTAAELRAIREEAIEAAKKREQNGQAVEFPQIDPDFGGEDAPA